MDISPKTTVADVKGELARLGLDAHAEAQLVYRERAETATSVIIVDRIADIDGQPEYCVHGYATCSWCKEFCYLGNKTFEAAMDGAEPLCHQCAVELIPASTPVVGHLNDNKRTDGPHHD
jgi:hypothetical protein